MLEEHRPLSPGTRLEDRPALVVGRGGGLRARAPAGEVGRGQQARVAPARAVQGGHPLAALDRLRDEAVVERAECGLDLRLSISSRGLRFPQETPEGPGENPEPRPSPVHETDCASIDALGRPSYRKSGQRDKKNGEE